MSKSRRAIEDTGPGARRRWTAALLAALALLALPVSHGLALHHADHEGAWIATGTDAAGLGLPDTGESAAEPCPLCMASTSTGSIALPAAAELSAAPRPIGRLLAAVGTAHAGPGDLSASGPRAPPLA